MTDWPITVTERADIAESARRAGRRGYSGVRSEVTTPGVRARAGGIAGDATGRAVGLRRWVGVTDEFRTSADDIPDTLLDELAESHDITTASVLTDELVGDAVEQFAREFVEYVIDESDVSVGVVSPVDDEAVNELLHALDCRGYRTPDTHDERGAVVSIYAAPEQYEQLRTALPNHALGDGVDYRGVEIYSDTSIPDGVLVAVHHDAITPTPPGRTAKPWLVKDPGGVAVLDVADEPGAAAGGPDVDDSRIAADVVRQFDYAELAKQTADELEGRFR